MTGPVNLANDEEEKLRCITDGMAEQIGLFFDCYLGGFIDSEIAAAEARLKHLKAIRSGAFCTYPKTPGVVPSESVSATSIADVLEN